MPAYDDRTALLVVDLQNDFADPRGALSVSGAAEIIPLVTAEVRLAREAGALVIYTQDWHPPHTPHFKQDGGIWPVHCVQGTWGAAFHSDLAVDGPVVRKGTGGEDGYSGFTVREPSTGATSETPLAGLLRQRGIERVVVVGLATDYCVKETALDAVRQGFHTTVRREAVRAVELEPGDAECALSAMLAAGVHLE